MAVTTCDDKHIVLIVDDEEMIEEMMGALVEEYGCPHVSFDDPVKALRHYEENARNIALLVTDLTMPSMSGSDLVRKVLEINPELPIILVTNYVGEDIPGDIPPLVRGTVSKPFTRSEFFHVLQKTVVRAERR
ncbi:MAG: response regulator [Syntrophorhabdales bacterium]|jgi:FixJ family two-component response regulator